MHALSESTYRFVSIFFFTLYDHNTQNSKFKDDNKMQFNQTQPIQRQEKYIITRLIYSVQIIMEKYNMESFTICQLP